MCLDPAEFWGALFSDLTPGVDVAVLKVKLILPGGSNKAPLMSLVGFGG